MKMQTAYRVIACLCAGNVLLTGSTLARLERRSSNNAENAASNVVIYQIEVDKMYVNSVVGHDMEKTYNAEKTAEASVAELPKEATEVISESELHEEETEKSSESGISDSSDMEISEESENSEESGMKISEEDVRLLQKATYAEAGICSEEAQRGVAATILERGRERGESIREVIFERGQFSCAKDGEIYLITNEGNIPVTDEMVENEKTTSAVLEAIENGAGENITSAIGGEPLYFYTPTELSEKESFARESISKRFQVDKMVFYRVWD